MSEHSDITELRATYETVMEGHRYTREHFTASKPGTFVGRVPADEWDAALDATLDAFPSMLAEIELLRVQLNEARSETERAREVARTAFVRDLQGLRDHVAEQAAEIDRLRAELDAAQLRSIEARNPGIDMDDVRARRAALVAPTPEPGKDGDDVREAVPGTAPTRSGSAGADGTVSVGVDAGHRGVSGRAGTDDRSGADGGAVDELLRLRPAAHRGDAAAAARSRVDAEPRPSEIELPGMWEYADFEGGLEEVRGPEPRPACPDCRGFRTAYPHLTDAPCSVCGGSGTAPQQETNSAP